jgi:hypothetical protein
VIKRRDEWRSASRLDLPEDLDREPLERLHVVRRAPPVELQEHVVDPGGAVLADAVDRLVDAPRRGLGDRTAVGVAYRRRVVSRVGLAEGQQVQRRRRSELNHRAREGPVSESATRLIASSLRAALETLPRRASGRTSTT